MIIPNSQSSLTQWIDWLLHLHADEIDLGLERIRLVANQMQVTRPAPFVITVAGTNGKGSSVAMLSAILKEAGYQVGTYTSPHILTFNERIQINGQPVSDQLIVNAFDSIESQRQATKLTYFEFSTLAALTIFKQAQLDVVVLEVGLGGRLDAVNLVDADASLITAIDVDHIDWLGDDRNLIALEKAGIMRAQQISVCSDPNPPSTLLEFAQELKVKLSVLNKDFNYSSTPKDNQAWLFETMLNQQSVITLPKPALQGDFQLQNASGVVALILNIATALPVSDEAICRGLKNVKHPGRLEQLQINHQAWLIDVAHNPQSAEVLAQYLSSQNISSNERVAVFSALNDKDMLPMVKAISPWVQKWLIADLKIARSTNIDTLKNTLLTAGVADSEIEVCETIGAAVDLAKSVSQKNVLVWGSFFTVSQAYQVIKTMNKVKGLQ